MVKPTVIIVHGWKCHPSDGWYATVAEELRAKDFVVVVPDFGQDEVPRLTSWLSVLSSVTQRPDENTYFIGHSLGCLAVMNYLSSVASEKIGGCILVAGFDQDLGHPQIMDFFSKRPDYTHLRKMTDNYTLLISTTDTAVPLQATQALQHALNARLIIEQRKGHFTAADGVTTLPSVVNEVLRMEKSKGLLAKIVKLFRKD